MKTSRTLAALALLSFFLLPSACPGVQGQTGRKTVGRSAAQPASAVRRLGVFTNMRYTAEHQYGYSVELWREKDRVFGLLLVSAGLAGDTPTGLLEDVSFDPKTGRLTFRARLSTGSTFDENNQQVPTRDVYEFSGALKGQRLTGTLEHTDSAGRSAASEKTRVSLRKSKSESASMIQPGSYDEWKREADEILKLRGPKW